MTLRLGLGRHLKNLSVKEEEGWQYESQQYAAHIRHCHSGRGQWKGGCGVNGCALGITRGNITMILEVAILNIRPGDSADFERAFAEAQAIIASMPGYGWGRSADC